MNTPRTASPRSERPARPEQLTLLDASHVPLQFRLDAATRRRGLAHVAQMRQLIAAQAARVTLGQPAAARPDPLAA